MPNNNGRMPEHTPLWQDDHVRSDCTNTERDVVMCAIVILIVLLFCGVNMLLFKFHEHASYPKEQNLQVPSAWIERAIAYNTYSANDKAREYPLPRGHYVPSDGDVAVKLVCYYNFPSTGRSLQVANIDPHLCTHINLGFATVINNQLNLTNDQITVLKSLVDLKSINTQLKILISVGGAGENNGFPQMVLNHVNRKTFIRSVIRFVKMYNIDGIDLDWEFPYQYNANNNHHRMHFTQLLEEFRMAINKQNKHKFLLSVAVAAPVILIDNSYDVSYMNQYVDYINLMSYDYHFYTRLTPFTGFNAPLYQSESDRGYLATLNINYTVHYWMYKGMDKRKIIVGLPTYGHSFGLVNTKNHELYAPADSIGKSGVNGFVDYNQICSFLTINQISPVFDMDTKSPYATRDYEWISFDDEQSLQYKAEFVRNHKLGGVMIYSLGSDDFWGVCKMNGKTQKFPLTRTVKKVLFT